jgi:hypothetical protein
MPTLYALLVGINGYQVKPLHGCINDVKSVEEYLRKFYAEGNSSGLEIKSLTDETPEKPTRQNLINAFDFFSKAKDGDTCLFYYSGHGSYSTAPPEFRQDSGRVQSFVCIDSRLPGGKDLMDKEMSYLIFKTVAAKPKVKFIAITDCCHSGTIVRALEDNSSIVERMISGEDGHTPARAEDYLGFNDSVGDQKAYTEEWIDGRRVIKVAQGANIHLAASMDNQTSKELQIDGVQRGAFTHSMLKTLFAQEGQINYKDLVNRSSVLVKNLVESQDPGISVNGGLSSSEADKIFLSDQLLPNRKFQVYYDRLYGWCINGGPMHAITKGDIVWIEGIGKSMVLNSPMPGVSVIMSKLEFGANENIYKATVQRQPNQAVSFSFVNNISADIRQLITDASVNYKSEFVSIRNDDKNGRYIIRSNDVGEVMITLPGSEKPVFKPVVVNELKSAGEFIERLEIVANWTSLLEFDNVAGELSTDHYEIHVYRSAKPGNYNTAEFTEIDPLTALNDFYYRQANDKWYQPALRLSITNKLQSGELYVNTAYLNFDYSINDDLFTPLQIGPGNTAWLEFIPPNKISTDVVKLKIDQGYQRLGYTSITEYLKLFISTGKAIDITKLKQSGVELAANRGIAAPGAAIGRGTGAEEEELSEMAWQTETIGLHIIKPGNDTILNGGSQANIGAVSLTLPTGLTGSATIGSSASAANKDLAGIPPPHLAAGNSMLAQFDLIAGVRSASASDMLELFDINNRELVSPENPITISFPAQRSYSDDLVLPIGFDKETGLYYPLGHSDENGNIIIETLPEETPSDAAITKRSFLGSIKIYFQKVIGSKLGLGYDYPRLAIATVNSDGKTVYDADENHVKEAVAKATNIALFVHGIIGDTEGMAKCVDTKLDDAGSSLHKQFDLVLSFDYENLNTKIEDTAAALKQRLAKVGFGAGIDKSLTIIAHSMGGLVSRWFIEKLDGHQSVKKLIMLGTPNNGTPWADVRDMAEAFVTFGINGAAFLKPWLFILSAIGKFVKGTQITLQQMDAKTGIFKTLNDGTDPKIPYIIVAGNTQKIVVEYDQTASLVAKLFTKLKKKGAYIALDSLLFKKANDIAVTNESIITLNGSQQWTIQPVVHEVACDHLSYFITVQALSKI